MKRRSMLKLLGLAPAVVAVTPAAEPAKAAERADGCDDGPSPPAFSRPTDDELLYNRMTVDFASNDVVLYDADGVTELKRWHLTMGGTGE